MYEIKTPVIVFLRQRHLLNVGLDKSKWHKNYYANICDSY